MAITPLPTPPNRSMTPAAFITAADAFIEALPQFQEEANAAAEAMNLNDTTSTSTTSVVIGTGAKSLTVQASKSYVSGMTVKIARTSDGTKWMVGDVTSYNSGTGALAVTVSKIQGSGTFTDWTIIFASTEQLTDNSVATAMLQDDAVSSAKIAADAILAEHLSDSALGFAMINGTLTASVAANALTIAIKTKAGTDPSATDPVIICFRNASAATGDYVPISLETATSFVISSGSTLGTISGLISRIWVVGFNDAGTFRLGAINLSTNVPFGDYLLATSTAEGGAGGADSAGVYYTGTAVGSSRAIKVLGYVETTQATAGTWATAPSKVQLYGAGVPLHGAVVQVINYDTGAVATGSSTIPIDDTIPQQTEGDQYMEASITPTSTANILLVEVTCIASTSAAGTWITAAVFKDAGADAIGAATTYISAANGGGTLTFSIKVAASSSSFKLRIGPNSAATITFNGNAGARRFGGIASSSIRITEIAA